MSPSPYFLHRLVECATRDPSFPLLRVYSDATASRLLAAGELCSEAAARAAWIKSRTEPQALVFIIENDPLQQILWWLGSLFAGATPGILTPPTPKLDRSSYHRDLVAILAAYPSALVLYGADVFAADQVLDPRCVPLTSVRLAHAPIPPLSARRTQPLIFQQSSGTTGLRKGILISEDAAIAHAESYGSFIQIGTSDVIVSWLPLYHDMGLVACLMSAIYWMVPLVITSPFVWLTDAAWLFRAIHAHGGTLCWLPNFAFKYLSDRADPAAFPANALSTLRMAINCSEPVHAGVMAEFTAKYAAIGLCDTVPSASYAMAENTFAVTQVPPGTKLRSETIDQAVLETERRAQPSPAGRTFASSGIAVPATQIRIRKDGAPCGDGDVGEIEIKSPFLMEGYVGIGSAIAKPLSDDGWFATGDLGYLRDGHLFVIGRSKDIIIRAGRNIDPGFLEAALAGIAGLKPGRWVVFGIDNPKDGTEDVILLAELDGTAEARTVKPAIVKACNVETGIAPQKVELVEANWLVKSSSGKISRAACRKKYAETYLR